MVRKNAKSAVFYEKNAQKLHFVKKKVVTLNYFPYFCRKFRNYY